MCPSIVLGCLVSMCFLYGIIAPTRLTTSNLRHLSCLPGWLTELGLGEYEGGRGPFLDHPTPSTADERPRNPLNDLFLHVPRPSPCTVVLFAQSTYLSSGYDVLLLGSSGKPSAGPTPFKKRRIYLYPLHHLRQNMFHVLLVPNEISRKGTGWVFFTIDYANVSNFWAQIKMKLKSRFVGKLMIY